MQGLIVLLNIVKVKLNFALILCVILVLLLHFVNVRSKRLLNVKVT